MFKFKLQPVLALKEKVEDHKKRELGIATQHQEVIYAQKLELMKKKQEILRDARECGQAMIDIQGLRHFNHYTGYMNSAIEKNEAALQEAKKKVTMKRSELLEAVKERKILENLKGLEEEVFQEEEKREAQRVNDDLVTYRYGKKGRK